MIVLAVDLPGPFPIGQVSFKSYLPGKKIYLSWTTRRELPPGSLSVIKQSGYTVEPNFTNPHLIQTPRYYGQFALSLGNKSPYIFSKFNPLNTGTPLKRRVFVRPGTPGPLIGYFNSRLSYFIRRYL